MRALFDVNVLIALLDSNHVGHSVATGWFLDHLEHGWASCPITENGTARIMASTSYPNTYSVAAVIHRLTLAKSTAYHSFWHDDISVTDSQTFNQSELLGPKQITDRYLLALAIKHGGRFVTFDQSISLSGVVGGDDNHLVRLSG